MSNDSNIRPFRIDVPQPEVEDLRDRLARTRWPKQPPGIGWSRGVPVDYLKGLAGYWADGFDWRGQQARLNELPQFVTEIDGQPIHFLHVRSSAPDALPLILTHGWPSSPVEFLRVIGPLTDRREHRLVHGHRRLLGPRDLRGHAGLPRNGRPRIRAVRRIRGWTGRAAPGRRRVRRRHDDPQRDGSRGRNRALVRVRPGRPFPRDGGTRPAHRGHPRQLPQPALGATGGGGDES